MTNIAIEKKVGKLRLPVEEMVRSVSKKIRDH